MSYAGYREEELVQNRVPLLLHGGSEADRRAWATEAGSHFALEGPLVQVAVPAELAGALARVRGVVFIADVLGLGSDAQLQILRCLQREERPKLILGLGGNPAEASARGLLRDDLRYRLQQAQVDLSAAGLKEALRNRRQAAESKLLAAQAKEKPAKAAGGTKKGR